ncbi:hypothetical protein AAFF_G00309970 [Aldrovandia affinis]|uniref:Uncharacterized protein n=1 Tax=Aldrovandia affinis TaxID=143900 RepID=A0AAD7WRX1_9TELE|nr:hypothetical protein AAFF_G00309970 [Aldrovandia affinis]
MPRSPNPKPASRTQPFGPNCVVGWGRTYRKTSLDTLRGGGPKDTGWAAGGEEARVIVIVARGTERPSHRSREPPR